VQVKKTLINYCDKY